MRRSMLSARARGVAQLSLWAVAVFLLPVTGWAQQPPQGAPAPSKLVEREQGEEEEIRERREWFIKSRLQGVLTMDQARRLRAEASEQTALRAEQLRAMKGRGFSDANNFWTQMGPSGSHFGGWAFGDISGRVTALAKDSAGALYVGGAAGGVWKSTNDGLSWTSLLDAVDTQAVGAIAVDPNNTSVVWVATGDYNTGCEGYFGVGMLRSIDGGASWQKRNGSGAVTLNDVSAFSAMVVDPRNSSHVLAAATSRGCSSGSGGSGGIFTTDDAGATWAERLSGVAVYALAQDQQTKDNYWAATNQGIYKSTNNGVTWTKQTASSLPSSNTSRTELAIAPSNGNVVYALFANGPTGTEFWRTINGGTSWTKMSSGSNACDGQCTYNMTLAVHSTNTDIVYRGTVLLFKSINGGSTWTQLTNGWGGSQQVHQDTQELLVDALAPETFYVGSDGGVWRSVDGGTNYTCLNTNLNMTQFYAIDVHPTDGDIICGGAQDNSSLARPTGTNKWELQTVTGDGFVCQINRVNPNYAYITSYPSGGPSVYRSTTGVFGSFNVITGSGSGVNSSDRWNWVTPYILDPVTPSTLYLGSQRIYKSINNGDSWSPVGPADLTGGSGTVYALEVNRNFPNVVFAGTESGRVWRSSDYGINWTDITSGLPGRGINDIAADPTNPKRAFATVGGFSTAHLWEWTEAGGWVARGGDLPNVPANTAVMLSSNELYVGTDVGVFHSTDGGVTNLPFVDGLPKGLVVTDLKYSGTLNKLTAGSYARGAWQVSLDPVGPIVIFDSIVLPLTEVDGDGDGSVEPGETFDVTPKLKNAGGLIALGVQARLFTATPGVTVLQPSSRSYGDIAGGAVSPAATPYRFTVDPSFPCGSTIVFDLVNVTSTNAPGTYSDLDGAFTVTVLNNYLPPAVSSWLDEDFDPLPTSGWTHQLQTTSLFGCNVTWRDDWKTIQKDAAHGQSYHCGNGPGTQYPKSEYAWLYYGGKDSTNGPGIDIPADAMDATMTMVHWYNTQAGADGGQVGIDSIDDNQDTYVTITPNGGYTGALRNGFCNPLQGKQTFNGTSGGWITTTFDLTSYRGKKIYLAFIFGSDTAASSNEGWYIDQVKVESRVAGLPVCQTTQWPGLVPNNALFTKVGGGQVQATWSSACNSASLPSQLYSIQSGNLDTLASSGSYTHAPLAGACSRTSPTTFTPSAGNEYYLVVANQGGREGGAGKTSAGTDRPQASTVCGQLRAAACP
ncbi:MAG: immune inhibitor A [Acidobacteriota bacterium]